MGTDTTRLNSEIQGYMENYSWLGEQMYRKDPFWDVVKYMIYKIIYLFENAQSPAIAGLFYKIRKNLYVLIDCYEQNERLIQTNLSVYKALL